MLDDKPQKIFTLQRAEDDSTIKTLRARDEVVADRSLKLGARLLFVAVLDLAVRSNTYHHWGSVNVSLQKLADIIGVSVRSIWQWKTELVARGRVWLDQQPLPNAWPIDRWHISALDPPGHPEKLTTPDGLWGNGERRPMFQPQSVRRSYVPRGTLPDQSAQVLDIATPSGNGLPLPVATGFYGESQRASTGSRNGLPLPVATGFHGESQRASTGSRNGLPLPVATGFHGESQRASTGSRNGLPLPVATGFQHKKAQDGSLESPEASFKRSTLNAKKTAQGERFFLLHVAESMERWKQGSSKAELENSGGWWRMAYRADRELMTRVLADVSIMVKEGRVIETPGQAAVDLWKRWGGKIDGAL